MPWLYITLHDVGCLTAICVLVCTGHPWWAAVPAISFVFLQVRAGGEE